MVALDTTFVASSDARAPAPYTSAIVLVALAAAVAVAAAGYTFGDHGFHWRNAGEMVSRFSLIVFVAAMVVEPLAHIFRVPATKAMARERGSLILAFAMVSIVSLACALTPSQFGAAKTPLPALGYALMTGGILLVMLFSGHPATKKFLGAPAWRTMQRIAVAYFWLVFTVTALEHIVSPTQPDPWWGISLLLLAAAVLVQFVEALLTKLRGAPVAEKAA
jgi:hypothetical protein